MSQPNKSVRLLRAAAMSLVIVIVLGVVIFKQHRKPPIVKIVPATAAATQPATAPVVAAEPPPRTYFELIHREFPKLATTQPVDQPLNMRDWGHFLIPYPVYVDRRGFMWITHPEAEETDALLSTASSRQVNLTRERVLF